MLPFETFMYLSEEQANAPLPIEVTLSGMVIPEILQDEKARLPIEITLFGITMLVIFSHPENALLPI